MGRTATDERPRKRRRRRRAAAAVDEGADCFSSLPNDILLLIASHLPTRTAVSLSLLARRFRLLPTLFKRVDSVSFSLSDPSPLSIARPFLLRRLSISRPKTARPYPFHGAFHRVLNIAADHGISELAIRLRRCDRLPRNVLSIRSLTVLSLDTCTMLRWSNVACARLRTLKLHRVVVRQEIITAVLAAAPLLETLELLHCTGYGKDRHGCTLESTTVRNLLFKPPLQQQQITIRTAGLRTVTLYTRPKTLSVQLGPAPEIRKAYLHIGKPHNKLEFRIRPFLDAGMGLICLTLRGSATMLLSSEYKDIPKLAITFQDLRILSVSLDFSSESEPTFLLKLLESCPNLQQLTISALLNEKKSALPSFADHGDWLTKLSCLSESLVQFNFVGLKPHQQYQKELVILVLSQAKRLKKMEVVFDRRQEAMVREILSVKRAPTERKSTKYGQCCLELEYP